MTHRLLPLLALVATVPGAAQDPAPGPQRLAGTQWAQLSIHERIVIRIPRMPRDPAFAPPAFAGEASPRWIERKGARCVEADDIIGATLPNAGPDVGPGARRRTGLREGPPATSVDLILDDGQRTRALLEADCPALDYYVGFYIKPAVDGRVCAGRDAIRSRSGAVCPIRAFRRLVPAR